MTSSFFQGVTGQADVFFSFLFFFFRSSSLFFLSSFPFFFFLSSFAFSFLPCRFLFVPLFLFFFLSFFHFLLSFFFSIFFFFLLFFLSSSFLPIFFALGERNAAKRLCRARLPLKFVWAALKKGSSLENSLEPIPALPAIQPRAGNGSATKEPAAVRASGRPIRIKIVASLCLMPLGRRKLAQFRFPNNRLAPGGPCGPPPPDNQFGSPIHISYSVHGAPLVLVSKKGCPPNWNYFCFFLWVRFGPSNWASRMLLVEQGGVAFFREGMPRAIQVAGLPVTTGVRQIEFRSGAIAKRFMSCSLSHIDQPGLNPGRIAAQQRRRCSFEQFDDPPFPTNEQRATACSRDHGIGRAFGCSAQRSPIICGDQPTGRGSESAFLRPSRQPVADCRRSEFSRVPFGAGSS